MDFTDKTYKNMKTKFSNFLNMGGQTLTNNKETKIMPKPENFKPEIIEYGEVQNLTGNIGAGFFKKVINGAVDWLLDIPKNKATKKAFRLPARPFIYFSRSDTEKENPLTGFEVALYLKRTYVNKITKDPVRMFKLVFFGDSVERVLGYRMIDENTPEPCAQIKQGNFVKVLTGNYSTRSFYSETLDEICLEHRLAINAPEDLETIKKVKWMDFEQAHKILKANATA